LKHIGSIFVWPEGPVNPARAASDVARHANLGQISCPGDWGANSGETLACAASRPRAEQIQTAISKPPRNLPAIARIVQI
jgi:hypothetical protein